MPQVGFLPYLPSTSLFLNFSKTKLDVLYYFWGRLIIENDQLFMHFFILSFLMTHKDSITNADYSQIPSILSQMSIKDKECVDRLFDLANVLRLKTPSSFRLLAQKLEIFKPKSQKLKELFELYEPENMISLPIFASEIFHIAYSNIIACPDSMCKNFYNTQNGDIMLSEKTHTDTDNSAGIITF
jgi:hypothetical protein